MLPRISDPDDEIRRTQSARAPAADHQFMTSGLDRTLVEISAGAIRPMKRGRDK